MRISSSLQSPDVEEVLWLALLMGTTF